MSARRERFIEEYLIDRNGAQAAIRAGYSQKTARQIACELLTKPDVSYEISRRAYEVSQRLQIDLETVLANLGEAFADAKRQKRPDLMIDACREIGRLCGFYDQPAAGEQPVSEVVET